MSARAAGRSGGLVVLVILSLVAVASPAAAVTDTTGAQSGQTTATTVTTCTVIDQPGRYELAGDITTDGTCIEITASDVVFDGRGYALNDSDPDSGGNGIEVNVNATGRLSNVTITDVVLTNWAWNGFGAVSSAVRMERVDDASITAVTVSGSDYGIRLRNVTASTIARSEISQSNNHGVYMDRRSDGNTLTSNAITRSDRRGLLLEASSNNTVEGNEIGRSGNENVRLAGRSSRDTFADNEIYNSGYTDACVDVATSVSRLRFQNNSVTGCGGNGISLGQGGSHSVLVGNNVSANQNHGIRLNYVRNVTLRDNVANGNSGHGISLQRSGNHTVANNRARGNERFGINLNDVDETTLRDNTVASNENGGLRFVSGSANNTVVGNTVLNYPRAAVVSFPTGIRLRTADDNDFRNNRVENSYVGVEINESANGNTLVDTRVNNTESALWTLVTTNSNGTTVDSLDIGPSSRANTTLSVEAYNVSIAPNASAPANPSATAIGRYVAVESMGSGATVDLSMQYEPGDVSAVDETLLALWTHDGSGWTAATGSTVNTRQRTVSANLTTFSTVGVFAGGDSDSQLITAGGTDDGSETVTGSDDSQILSTVNPSTDGADVVTGAPPAATDTGASAPTSGESGPGFGFVVAALALTVGALLRRRD